MPEVYGQISIEEVIITICAIIVLVVVMGSFFSFFYAIYLFLFSVKDKEAKHIQAKNTIRYMIIGVLLTVFFLGVLPLALKAVNIELKNYTTSAIFSRIGDVIQKTFQVGTAVKNGQTDTNRVNQYDNTIDATPTAPSSAYQL